MCRMGLCVICFFPLAALLLATSVMASPRTQTGACGSVLPGNAQLVAKHRYNIPHMSNMYELLKFYRKVFGRNNTDYSVSKLLALPHVVAYHIKNHGGQGSWKGMNLVHYRHRNRMQIFVLCPG